MDLNLPDRNRGAQTGTTSVGKRRSDKAESAEGWRNVAGEARRSPGTFHDTARGNLTDQLPFYISMSRINITFQIHWKSGSARASDRPTPYADQLCLDLLRFFKEDIKSINCSVVFWGVAEDTSSGPIFRHFHVVFGTNQPIIAWYTV